VNCKCFFGYLILKLLLEANDRRLMKARDSKKYRHNGLRTTHVNIIMEDVQYKCAIYEINGNPPNY